MLAVSGYLERPTTILKLKQKAWRQINMVLEIVSELLPSIIPQQHLKVELCCSVVVFFVQQSTKERQRPV